LPGGITQELRTEETPPPGYVSVTEFAKLAGVRRPILATEIAEGQFSLERMCRVPWRGRYGFMVFLDTSYLDEYLDCRESGTRAQPAQPPAPKLKPSSKSKKPKTRRVAGPKQPPSPPPEKKASSAPPVVVQKLPPVPVEPPGADSVVDAKIEIDTSNTHSKSYWTIEHTRIKAIHSALELQKARNEVLSVTQAAETMQEILLVIKQTLLAIPGRVAPSLSGESDVIRIRDLLEKEIKRSLKELSKVDRYLKANS